VAVRKLVRRKRDGYDLRFDDEERELLGHLLDELRSLLIAENPASDPGVARLFPPAYPDDLLQNLDYERGAGNELLAQRLATIDEAEQALAASRVSEEQLMALLRAVNDLRLVYGVKLEVTEESGRSDFTDDRSRATFDLYVWLGWLVEHMVSGLNDG
jgi:Domain of unknown function (DUF2017)